MNCWTGSWALFSFALLLNIASPAQAAPNDADFAQIRNQPAIAASFDFKPLPPNAGKGITVAIVSGSVSKSLATQVGKRLTVVSAIANDATPYAAEGEQGSYFGNNIVSIVAALAPKARIISIKVVDDMGEGSNKAIEDGINRAVAMGARIIVAPVGSPDSELGVARAVNNALRKGILCVVSAGNTYSGPINFPANVYGVLAIGAFGPEGHPAAFSSVGEKVLYAPGVNITAVQHTGTLYAHSGTSHASPVAGAIFADLWSQNPKLTPQQLVNAVFIGAKKADDGHGGTIPLMDAAAALQVIKAGKVTAQHPGREAIESRTLHFAYEYRSGPYVRIASGTVEDIRGLSNALAKLQPPSGAHGGYGLLGDDYLLGQEKGYGLQQLGSVWRQFVTMDSLHVEQPAGFEEYGVQSGTFTNIGNMKNSTLGWVMFDLRDKLEADLKKRFD